MNEKLTQKLLESASKEQWNKIGVKHHHGIVVPLFSLHTKNSCGIGEYPDLIPLARFCRDVGFDVIQLLPLNDTGLDFSPYNSISAFALNPLHLSLRQLPFLEKVPHYQERLERLESWNRHDKVPYGIVRELRSSFLKDYIQLIEKEISNSTAFKDFQKEHQWVEPFGLFKAIKEAQGWTSWEDWPPYLKSPSRQGYLDLLKEYSKSRLEHELTQFFCYSQLTEAKKIANQEGVLIKGDIPILIARDSCDVWMRRNYFMLHLAAGAPPDMYAKEGQYWGFPIYDWTEMEKYGFDFWKERLKAASSLYDLYRIDHAVGFFRIFAIPTGKKPKDGFFMPEDTSQWVSQGSKIMETLLKSSTQLPIAEDLGVVPPEVRMTLRNLGIPGTKVMRWERNWLGDGKFIPLNEYIEESMTTVSTHDSDTLQLWWRHSPKEAKAFAEFKGWDYKPFLSLDRHKEILRASHHTSSLFHINLLQEYLALFPDLVSSHPLEERINIPGKVLVSNWTYKFRPSVEELQAHEPLKKALREIIKG